ncbi:hypothetical protein [Paenibacillus sp. GYB004]|uniref:hypothetical protein n=1 Tax=Paenibacillus sp. GYB004 TaxID=2994393 RepID=UPI003FA6EFFF
MTVRILTPLLLVLARGAAVLVSEHALEMGQGAEAGSVANIGYRPVRSKQQNDRLSSIYCSFNSRLG